MNTATAEKVINPELGKPEVNEVALQPAAADNAAPILALIQQVANDPNSDVDKMERLMAMHIDMVERDAVQAYKKAMSICQSEMPIVVKDAVNDQTDSLYAKFENILITTQSTYTRNGFALSFGTDLSPINGYIRITCEVMHMCGHSKDYFVDLPPDLTGIRGTANKTGIHAAGSTFSYGKRYLFCMIFNIAVANEENDGTGGPAAQISYISEADEAEIVKLCKATSKAVESCFAYLNKQFGTNYDSLSNLSPEHGTVMINRLEISLAKVANERSAQHANN